MNLKNLLTFGIFSIIFGLYSTEYAPSVSDEIREQNEQNQYQQKKPNVKYQQEYHHKNNNSNNDNASVDDDVNNEKQQKQYKTKKSLDKSTFIMSSMLDRNNTEFETSTNGRTTSKSVSVVTPTISSVASSSSVSSLLSSSLASQIEYTKNYKISDEKFLDNLPENFNTTMTASQRTTTKTKKFRGKRKKFKIRKNSNIKYKLKYDQQENYDDDDDDEENNSKETSNDNNNNDNTNHNHNNSNNKKIIKKKQNINRFSKENLPFYQQTDENIYPFSSSIESSASSASSALSDERKFLVAKNKSRKYHRNKKQRKRNFHRRNQNARKYQRPDEQKQMYRSSSSSSSISGSSNRSSISNSNSNSYNKSNLRGYRNSNIRNKFKISSKQPHNYDEIDVRDNDNYNFQHHQHHRYHHNKQHNHYNDHNQNLYNNNNPKEYYKINHIKFNNVDNNNNDFDTTATNIDDDDNDNDDDDNINEYNYDELHQRINNKKHLINIDIDADIIDKDENNDYNIHNREISVDKGKGKRKGTHLSEYRKYKKQNFHHKKKNEKFQKLRGHKNFFQHKLENQFKTDEEEQLFHRRRNDEEEEEKERQQEQQHEIQIKSREFNKTEMKNLNNNERRIKQRQSKHQQQEKLENIEFNQDDLIPLSSKLKFSKLATSYYKNGHDDNVIDPNDNHIDDIDDNDLVYETDVNLVDDADGGNMNDGKNENEKHSSKYNQQYRLKEKQQLQHQNQQLQQKHKNLIENINHRSVSTLNHHSASTSQEKQLMMMKEKINQQRQQNKTITPISSSSTSKNNKNDVDEYKKNVNRYKTVTTYDDGDEKRISFDKSIQTNRFIINTSIKHGINTNKTQNQKHILNVDSNNFEDNNKQNGNTKHNRNDSINDIDTSDKSNNSGSQENQEDFITSQHSVEKLMEITSIEKNIDENETGDLSCFQNDEFKPAPEIPHANIKYLRNEENGVKMSFLEVEYICHTGYELQMANNNDDGDDDIDSQSNEDNNNSDSSIERRRNVFCKNNNWIGTPPFCVKIDEEIIQEELSNEDDSLNSKNKYDKNEKCNNPGKCDQLCYIENGIEKCACNKGFIYINTTGCEDINECIVKNGHGPCQDICINTWGSYKCSCENIIGSHLNTDGHTCMEIDECGQNNGGCSHTCLHTMGRAYCLCPEGYTLDKDWKTCVDIDECAEQASDDSSELRCEFGCINTPGSYTCLVDFGAEQSIYEETLTECADGFYHNSSAADCEDIDECADKNGGCHHRCINTFGSYYCSCLPGYHIDSDMKSCVAPPAMNSFNSTNGIFISCPPLFPPKHGYLECSRSFIESNIITETETNSNDNIYETNVRNISISTISNTNSHKKNNIDVLITDKNGNNMLTAQSNNSKQQQQQQVQQEQQQQPHLTTNRPGSQCVLRCPTGFRINGNFSKQCNSNGKWIGDDDGTCIRYPTPKLICPSDVVRETPPNERMAKLRIPKPRTDVNFERDVSIIPEFMKTTNYIAFEIGSRNVTYTAKNPVSKLSISCSFTITVVEGESPTVNYCPGTEKYSLEKQHDSIKVNWKEPIFQDNINVTEISKTNAPGNNFGIGTHQIVYIAKDEAGYSARCIFKIVVNVTPEDVLIHPLPFYRMFYKK